MRITSFASLVIIFYYLAACSNTAKLPDIQSLSIKSIDNQYYYCESCPKPTKLLVQLYKPLEPDESAPAINPVIMLEVVAAKPISMKPSYKPKSKRIQLRTHKKYKKQLTRHNQCIKWS